MTNKHPNKCLISLIIREIKLSMKYYYTPTRTATVKRKDNTKHW